MSSVEVVARLELRWVLACLLLLTLLRLAALQANGGAGRGVADMLDAIVFAGILVFLIIRPFFMQTCWIPSGSMRPTLREHDYVLVNKFVYRIREPRRGEIVAFRAPFEALQEDQREGATDFIKRAVGLPGDVMDIHSDSTGDRRVYLNGRPLKEPYVTDQPQEDMKVLDGHVYVIDPLEGVTCNGFFVPQPDSDAIRRRRSEPIPPGKLLVLGDNRTRSSDGRRWGLLDINRLIGRADVIFWPPARWGAIR